MRATYFLVFSVAKLGTRYSGGHAGHGIFACREDAERLAARFNTEDGDNEYQVCEFAAEVRDGIGFMLRQMQAE